ncbi:MAG: MerR family transcriptional regulator [Pirellulales bacterium]|nr:MerR family transcriptional regulator [Pirellulales bacterium]
MYSIGEFSRATGLTVKTLRFYHEKRLLEPRHVDPDSGYRYYHPAQFETARAIVALRSLEFPLEDIAAILAEHTDGGNLDEGDLIEFLRAHKAEMEQRLSHYQDVAASLNQIISRELEARTAMQNANYDVQEKTVDRQLVAGYRMRGRYQDCGQGYAKIGRAFGRHICGKALMLIYDQEYKEDDADFETCLPIRKGESKGEIAVRELPSQDCIALLHKGPYDTLNRSYNKVMTYIKDRGYEILSPCREVYLKGPGMIFKGNPKKYLTEIQIPVRK